jgi:glutamine synthetase adenylyltransferase
VDIEFVAQKLKLARALAEPEIKPFNTMEILEAARDRGWSLEGAGEFIDAYKFFRTAELHMRMEYGRGAESLPDDAGQMELLEELIRPYHPFAGSLADKTNETMEKVKNLLGRKQ